MARWGVAPRGGNLAAGTRLAEPPYARRESGRLSRPVTLQWAGRCEICAFGTIKDRFDSGRRFVGRFGDQIQQHGFLVRIQFAALKTIFDALVDGAEADPV